MDRNYEADAEPGARGRPRKESASCFERFRRSRNAAFLRLRLEKEEEEEEEKKGEKLETALKRWSLNVGGFSFQQGERIRVESERNCH